MVQGVEAYDAARLGAYVHGLAGDIGVESVGVHSLTAEKIEEFIPHALMKISRY